jgi:hypothetical protein
MLKDIANRAIIIETKLATKYTHIFIILYVSCSCKNPILLSKLVACIAHSTFAVYVTSFGREIWWK